MDTQATAWLDDKVTGQIPASPSPEPSNLSLEKKKKRAKPKSKIRSAHRRQRPVSYKSTIESQDEQRPTSEGQFRSTNRSFAAQIEKDRSRSRQNMSRASDDGKKPITSHRSYLGQHRKNSVMSDLFSAINKQQKELALSSA